MNRIAGLFGWSLLAPCCLVLNCLAVAVGQDNVEPPEKLKTYEWTLDPAAEPIPALKHRLVTNLTEMNPGNAAIHYFRALVLERDLPRESRVNTDWFDQHNRDLPLAEVTQWLQSRRLVLSEIAAAGLCESCDWGIRFQDLRGRDVIEIRLMEFQEMRNLTRMLKLKAQVEIAEKRFDDAIATLRSMHRLAHDVGKAPSVIVSLVSTAISAVTNDVTGELIASDHSPNLYWALRSLPDPLLDRQAVAQLDANMVFQLFPFLKDADSVARPAEEWQRLLTDAIDELRKMTGSAPNREASATINQLSATMLLVRSYPIAKRALIASGMEPARVEQMPVGQVVAIYTRDCFQHISQEHLKWTSLPFHEGQPRLRELDQELTRDGYLAPDQNSVATRDPLGFNRMLMPTYLIGESYIRQRRMIALLATVEAIRMHLAANEGRFPESLAQIKSVPVPIDPATMKSFSYRLVNGQAELVALPTRPGDEYSGRRFVLRAR